MLWKSACVNVHMIAQLCLVLAVQCLSQSAVGLQEAMPHSLTPSVTASADLSSALALDNIRQTLIRQEDTIIFLLIERAQFARNAAVYEADAVPVPDFDAAGERFSLLEYLLRETEQIHGKIRRYTSPDEQAFYPDRVPQLVLPAIQYEQVTSYLQKSFCLHRNVMSPAYCKTSNTVRDSSSSRVAMTRAL